MHQILTDVELLFTVTTQAEIGNKAMLYIPPHLNRFSTLPCET